MEFSVRACPAHQRVLPASAAWQDVPVNTPTHPLCSTALHRVAGRLVYTNNAMTELGWEVMSSEIPDFFGEPYLVHH